VAKLHYETHEESGVPQAFFNRIGRATSVSTSKLTIDNVGQCDIETYNCNGKYDQKFFICSCGDKPVSQGKLYNMDSGKYRSSEHNNGEGNVILVNCADEDQSFTYCNSLTVRLESW
jgi:hypothetical protein